MKSAVLLLAILVATFWSSTCEYTGVDVNSATLCDHVETYAVNASSVFRLAGVAKNTSVTCKMSFTAVADVNACNGLCYMFHLYSIISDENVEFKIERPSKTETFTNYSVIPERSPSCSDDVTLDISLTLAPGFAYLYSNKTKQYRLGIDVFHKCGALGTAQSENVSHALLYATAYETREQFEANERETFLEGVAVSLSFAGFFFLVMFVGIFYTKFMK